MIKVDEPETDTSQASSLWRQVHVSVRSDVGLSNTQEKKCQSYEVGFLSIKNTQLSSFYDKTIFGLFLHQFFVLFSPHTCKGHQFDQSLVKSHSDDHFLEVSHFKKQLNKVSTFQPSKINSWNCSHSEFSSSRRCAPLKRSPRTSCRLCLNKWTLISSGRSRPLQERVRPLLTYSLSQIHQTLANLQRTKSNSLLKMPQHKALLSSWDHRGLKLSTYIK